ncbi:hypothetical protein, partial [Halopseudomonas pelagia]|uniref:hypothetical protein n=1 Tax=Halopseudomonas pelagia TaxID=553151 RepID=UPI00049028F3
KWAGWIERKVNQIKGICAQEVAQVVAMCEDSGSNPAACPIASFTAIGSADANPAGVRSIFVVLNNEHHPAKEAFPATLCCN